MPSTAMITEAGVYPSVPDVVYHRDPVAVPPAFHSLSSTAVRQILRSPAHGREYVLHGRPDTDALERGRAMHRLILGSGPDVEIYPGVDKGGKPIATWETKPAQEWRRKVRERGDIPALAREYDRLQAQADALRNDHEAARLLNRPGRFEVTVVAQDPETGLWLRPRLDWFPDLDAPGRILIWDLKNVQDASPDGIRRAIWRYRYDVQMAHILLTMKWAGLPVDPINTPAFLICQETAPPFVPTVAEIGVGFMIEDGLRAGAVEDHAAALRTYADCLASGRWPGYVTGRPYINPSRWMGRPYEGEPE